MATTFWAPGISLSWMWVVGRLGAGEYVIIKEDNLHTVWGIILSWMWITRRARTYTCAIKRESVLEALGFAPGHACHVHAYASRVCMRRPHPPTHLGPELVQLRPQARHLLLPLLQHVLLRGRKLGTS